MAAMVLGWIMSSAENLGLLFIFYLRDLRELVEIKFGGCTS